MIVMIDRIDFQNLTELQYITNFGITLEDYKSLKNLSKIGYFNKTELYSIYETMDIKQLLMLHKYFYIALTKIKNLHYRHEIEQIQENLYLDFVTVDKKRKILKLDGQVFAEIDPVKDKELIHQPEDKNIKPKLMFGNQNPNGVVIEQVTTQKSQKKNKNKTKFDQEDFPELTVENVSTIVQTKLSVNPKTTGKGGKKVPGLTGTGKEEPNRNLNTFDSIYNSNTITHKSEVKQDKEHNNKKVENASNLKQKTKFGTEDFPELENSTPIDLQKIKKETSDIKKEESKKHQNPPPQSNTNSQKKSVPGLNMNPTVTEVYNNSSNIVSNIEKPQQKKEEPFIWEKQSKKDDTTTQQQPPKSKKNKFNDEDFPGKIYIKN